MHEEIANANADLERNNIVHFASASTAGNEEGGLGAKPGISMSGGCAGVTLSWD